MSLPAMFDLSGQTMLVTGAASGLGLAISEALLEAGATVVMADINGEQLTERIDCLKDDFPKVSGVQLDVCDTPAVDRLLDDINTQLGAIDALFANAGISAGRGFMVESGRLDNIDMDHWHKVLSVNLDGVLATMRAASRHMKARGKGRIIVTSSIAGIRAEPVSGYAYVTSKAAVNNLVRQAAIELAPHNVLGQCNRPRPVHHGTQWRPPSAARKHRKNAHHHPAGAHRPARRNQRHRASAGFARLQLHDGRHHSRGRRRQRALRSHCPHRYTGTPIMNIVTGHAIAGEGAEDEIGRLALAHVLRSRQEPGCLSHEVSRDLENPRRLLFVERWADMAALQAHFQVPASRAFARDMERLTEGNLAMTIHRVDATRAS
ncbi:MAG: SDR family NAD(P)-dependent oxidoreductase [Giesbergeria sp.]